MCVGPGLRGMKAALLFLLLHPGITMSCTGTECCWRMLGGLIKDMVAIHFQYLPFEVVPS